MVEEVKVKFKFDVGVVVGGVVIHALIIHVITTIVVYRLPI